ncbi:MAG TPA: DUF6081 family protein [Dehalococcoidia bacterium]|nr:DUF6081 family protein [Dehalococcoidia bacterium]
MKKQTIVLGNYADLFKPESQWGFGGFPTPDGFWEYREPGAIVIVRDGRLRVTVEELTRSNGNMQFLDNAKHMYWSKEVVPCPDNSVVTVDLDIATYGHGTTPGDLYDGFVSVNLLDFANGAAIDFFVSHDRLATVYARLPFPGVPEPAEEGQARYFCLFKEMEHPGGPGKRHAYRMVYDKAAATLDWLVDGKPVNRETNVPFAMGSFLVALGIMTERDIVDGQSVSLHGQGVTAEWSPVTVTIEEKKANDTAA